MSNDDQVTLAEFQTNRLDELVAFWRASFEFGVGVKDPHSIEEQRQYFFEKLLPNNTVRMAILEDQLVGFVAASPSSVDQLHVRLGFHRRGIGTRMLTWAKAQSAGSLWLYTFASNTVAQAFYESQGFVIAERGFEQTWQLADIKYTWAAVSSLALPPA